MMSDFFFHFAPWKVLNFLLRMAIPSIPPLDFVPVKGIDGLGFLEKIAVSSIPLLDLSNFFFVPAVLVPMDQYDPKKVHRVFRSLCNCKFISNNFITTV